MDQSLVLVGPVHPYRGGIAHYTSQLGLELRQAGYPLRMVSFSRQYPAWLYPGKSDRDPSQEYPDMEAEYILDPLYPWTWLRAIRSISARHPGLVYIQWWTTFWGPALLTLAAGLRMLKIPIVFVVHNVMPHEARFYDRWIVKAVLSQARACITLSSNEEKRLSGLLPAMKIYPGQLPLQRLSSIRISKEEARKTLGIQASEQVLLFFGIVRPYKGLKMLLEALGMLAAKGLRPRLLVVGEFWEKEADYRAQIDALGLTAQVTVENRFIANEETPLYFSAADLFVAPYLEGTQSGAITVALDNNLPILASDRIITDPALGAMIESFPAGDVAALAGQLAAALRRGPGTSASAQHSIDNGWTAMRRLIAQVTQDLCSHS